MADLYAYLIMKGKRKLSDVPILIRDKVKQVLIEDLGLDEELIQE